MKAISVCGPWAWWIAQGLKKIETRSHAKFQGLVGQRIAIHQAKAHDGCARHVASAYCRKIRDDRYTMPFHSLGCIVCTAQVVDARWLTSSDSSLALCSCDQSRFGLFLDHVCKLETPIPYKGQQGIFTIANSLFVEA